MCLEREMNSFLVCERKRKEKKIIKMKTTTMKGSFIQKNSLSMMSQCEPKCEDNERRGGERESYKGFLFTSNGTPAMLGAERTADAHDFRTEKRTSEKFSVCF